MCLRWSLELRDRHVTELQSRFFYRKYFGSGSVRKWLQWDTNIIVWVNTLKGDTLETNMNTSKKLFLRVHIKKELRNWQYFNFWEVAEWEMLNYWYSLQFEFKPTYLNFWLNLCISIYRRVKGITEMSVKINYPL